MKFSDIIDLAKAGYKPSDIKELLELKTPEEKQEDTPEDKPEEKQDDKPKEKQEDTPEEKQEDTSEEKTDIKKEELKKQILKLQNQLKSVQSDNSRVDLSDKKEESDIELIEDLARSFM